MMPMVAFWCETLLRLRWMRKAFSEAVFQTMPRKRSGIETTGLPGSVPGLLSA